MKILSTLLFFTLYSFSIAQDRIEIPVNNLAETPYVASIGENGFFVLVDNPRGGQGGRTITVTKYDTAFKKVWEDQMRYDKAMPMKDLEVFEGNLYVLFQNSRYDQFEVVRVNGSSNEMERILIRHLPRIEFIDFLVTRGQFFMVGTLGREVIAIKADLKSRKVVPIPMAFRGKETRISHLAKSGNSVFITVHFKDRREDITLIREIEPISGKLIHDLVLKPDQEFDLISAQATILEGNQTIVMGTYAIPGSDFSQGFFFSKFSGNNEVSRRYNSFTDLTNFFSFLNSNYEKRMKEKAARKKSRGKDLKVKYLFLTHDVIPSENGYIFIGEAYYPVYRTERAYRYYRGMRVYDYVQVFDGYQHTHATVASLGSSGEVLWDQSFRIDEVKSFQLKERVSVKTDRDRAVLAYNSEGVVKMAQVNKSGLLSVQSEALADSGAKVRIASLGDGDFWYDQWFLFWGYQKISNDASNKKRRRVFYVNRISY